MGGTVTTIQAGSGENATFTFHASIEIVPTEKFFALRIMPTPAQSEFYIATNFERTRIASFFGAQLNPRLVMREESPWRGAAGGLDYLVDPEAFHGLIEEHTGLRKPAQRITMEMMRNFGWQESSLTDDYINRLNNTLELYGVTDINSIRLFMATCGHESGKGRLRLESLPLLSWVNYEPHERGAGYIQITWRETHLAFLESVKDSFSGQNTAEYIAQNYPWEAAAWFWTSPAHANLRPSLRLWSSSTLNMFTSALGDSAGIFLLML